MACLDHKPARTVRLCGVESAASTPSGGQSRTGTGENPTLYHALLDGQVDGSREDGGSLIEPAFSYMYENAVFSYDKTFG